MKKLFLPIILALLVAAVVYAAEFFPDITVTGQAGPWMDSRSYATFEDCIDAIGAGNVWRTVLIAESETVAADLVIPMNVHLVFTRTGELAFGAGVTITFNSRTPITAGDWRILPGTGTLNFVDGTVVRSAWFAFPGTALTTALDQTNNDTVTVVVSVAETLTESEVVGDDVTLRWESPFIITSGGFDLTGLKKIEAGTYQIFSGVAANDFDFLAGSVVHSSWFQDLNDAIEFTGDEDVDLTILVDQPETIDTDITIDIYQTLDIKYGCDVEVENGDTLTIQGPLNLNGSITGLGALTCSLTSNVYCTGGEIVVSGAIALDGTFESPPYHVFTGTGAVTGDPIVDSTIPEWWGAVGDGVTDDYTPVNAAFTHWFQRTIPGKFKFLSGKNYLIGTAITKTFAADILGAWTIDGYGSRITSDVAAGTLITFNNNTTDLRSLSILGLYFVGCGNADSLLKLDGGDSNVKYFYNVTLRDLFFANFDGNGLTLEGNIFESVLDNVRSQGKATNTTGYPIYINNGAGTGIVSSVSLFGCSTSYGLYGLYVQTPTGDVKVQESTFLSAQDYGAYLENNFGNTVLNCHFENNWQSEIALAAGQAGLYLKGAGTIQGCYATGNYQQHLAHIYSSTHVSITNNVIAAPLTSMVYVDGGALSFVTIIGNEDWLGMDDAPNVNVSRIGYTYKDFEPTVTVAAGEDDLMSYTLLDDNLGRYEGLRITAFGVKTGAGGNKILKFHFGATEVTFHAAANDTNDWRFVAEVINYRDDTNQMLSWVGYNGATALQGYDGSVEDTTGGDIIIKITGECANAGDVISQQGLIIERF